MFIPSCCSKLLHSSYRKVQQVQVLQHKVVAAPMNKEEVLMANGNCSSLQESRTGDGIFLARLHARGVTLCALGWPEPYI